MSAGMPNSSTAGIPSAAISPASSARCEIVSRSMPGHRLDRLTPVGAVGHEQRVDEVADRQVGLAHEAAQAARLSQPPQARGWKGHAVQVYCGPSARPYAEAPDCSARGKRRKRARAPARWSSGPREAAVPVEARPSIAFSAGLNGKTRRHGARSGRRASGLTDPGGHERAEHERQQQREREQRGRRHLARDGPDRDPERAERERRPTTSATSQSGNRPHSSVTNAPSTSTISSVTTSPSAPASSTFSAEQPGRATRARARAARRRSRSRSERERARRQQHGRRTSARSPTATPRRSSSAAPGRRSGPPCGP